MFVSSMQTALLLLRQDQPTHCERITPPEAPHTGSAGPFAQGSDSAEPAEGDSEPAKRPPAPEGFEWITFAGPGHCETRLVETSRNFRSNYKALREAVAPADTIPAMREFHSKVVVSTTLASASSQHWEHELFDAKDRFGRLVAWVAAANGRFHVLEEIDPLRRGIDREVAECANSTISTANRMSVQYGLQFAAHVEVAAEVSRLTPYMEQSEGGEFKITPFQIIAEDSRLVAELRDNGHFRLYNEDGSLLRDMNRADVCAELTPGTGSYARAAALAYSDDKDLQLY